MRDMFKVGDFVYSKGSPFGHDAIGLLIEKDGDTAFIQKHISYPKERIDYWNRADGGSEPSSLARFSTGTTSLEAFSFERFGEVLSRQPLIRPSEKDNFAEFLKQKIIEHFGSPPAKEIVEEEILTPTTSGPLVVEGHTEGFIRINNK